MPNRDSETIFRVADTLAMLQNHLQCVICLDILQNAVRTRCGHPFCRKCITDLLSRNKSGKAPCPLCNTAVSRRGFNTDPILQNLVKGALGIFAAAQKDTGVDLMLQVRGPKISTREAFSPTSVPAQSRRKVPEPTASTSKGEPKNNSKVETWLMDMSPPSSTKVSETVPQAEVASGADSDDSEMVSVSQIPPETIPAAPLPNTVDVFDKLMEEYQEKERVKATQHIEDDEDTGEEDVMSSVKNKRTVKSNTIKLNKNPGPSKPKGLSRRRSAPSKNKTESIIDAFSRVNQATSKKAVSSTVTKESSSEVPEPAVLAMDGEKENTKRHLPTRSPGWSRIKQMKKEFHDSPKTVLRSKNISGNVSSVSSIDGSTTGHFHDESMKTHSPNKNRVNEVANDEESENVHYENPSLNPSSVQNASMKCSNASLNVVGVEHSSDVIVQKLPGTDVKKLSNGVKKSLNVGVKRLPAPSINREIGVSNQIGKVRVKFLKLGKLFVRKSVVQFYLKGPLEHPSHDRISHFIQLDPSRCVDAQTQTSPCLETEFEVAPSFAVPPPGFGRKTNRKSDGSIKTRRSEGLSSEADTDFMDAETVIVTQEAAREADRIKPVSEPEEDSVKETMPLEDSSQQSVGANCLTGSVIVISQDEELSETELISTPYRCNDISYSQPTQLYPQNQQTALTPSQNTPLSPLNKVATPVSRIDPDDTCIISVGSPSQKRSSKRVRALSCSSSDSDIGFTKNTDKQRKKRKSRVLSDNEDSCPMEPNDPEMSMFDSSITSQELEARITANIEAGLRDSGGMKSPEYSEDLVKNSRSILATPKTPKDMFDLASQESKTQAETDDDSDIVESTPQKLKSFSSRDIVQSLQSEDIVPSSQPPIQNNMASCRPRVTKRTASLLENTDNDLDETLVETAVTVDNGARKDANQSLNLNEDLSESVAGVFASDRVEAGNNEINKIPPITPKEDKASVNMKRATTSVNKSPLDCMKTGDLQSKMTPPHTRQQDPSLVNVKQERMSISNNKTPVESSIKTCLRDAVERQTPPAPQQVKEDSVVVLAAEPPRAQATFVCSGLSAAAISQVEKLAQLHGSNFSKTFNSETTHLVVKVNASNETEKTLKYLSAVAAGKWIVPMKWVATCLQAQKLVPEEPFEVKDSSGEPGPKKSRLAQSSGQKLFENFEFCCLEDFPDLSKKQLEALLKDCGGVIVPDPKSFSNKNRLPITISQWDDEKEQELCSWLERHASLLVQHDWVLECIGKYTLASLSAHILCDVSEEALSKMGFPPNLYEAPDSTATEFE